MIAIVSGHQFEVIDYTITIDSTPLDSADSTGSVGEFSLTMLRPEFDLPDSLENLKGEEVEVSGDDHAFSGGGVSTVTETDHATLLLTGELPLGGLNLRNVAMPPVASTLATYFLVALARLKRRTTIHVDPSLNGREIVAPGWKGELWTHLKMLCAAESVEFVYTSDGIAHLRPVRQIEGRTLTGTNISRETNSAQLAQYIEVKEYNSRWVDSGIFYPPGGWSEDVEILSFNAGESVEFTLDLDGACGNLEPPTMVENVSRDHVSTSVYSIVGDDGFPVKPSMWTAYGGSLSVEIGDDFQHLIVKVNAPSGLPKDNGDEIQSYAIAVASGDTDPRYSSLRLVGMGIWFDNKDPLRFPTGVAANPLPEFFEKGEEVGVTIDNPFLSTRAHVTTAVMRAATKYLGYDSTISGTVQRLSDSATFTEDSGARVFYDTRPYRVRSTTYTPGGVQFTAEDDLTLGDMDAELAGLTYAQVQDKCDGLTYGEVRVKGYKL